MLTTPRRNVKIAEPGSAAQERRPAVRIEEDAATAGRTVHGRPWREGAVLEAAGTGESLAADTPLRW